MAEKDITANNFRFKFWEVLLTMRFSRNVSKNFQHEWRHADVFLKRLLGPKPNHKMDLAALLNGRKRKTGGKKPAGKKTKKEPLTKEPPRASPSAPAHAHDSDDDLYVRWLLG